MTSSSQQWISRPQTSTTRLGSSISRRQAQFGTQPKKSRRIWYLMTLPVKLSLFPPLSQQSKLRAIPRSLASPMYSNIMIQSWAAARPLAFWRRNSIPQRRSRSHLGARNYCSHQILIQGFAKTLSLRSNSQLRLTNKRYFHQSLPFHNSLQSWEGPATRAIISTKRAPQFKSNNSN